MTDSRPMVTGLYEEETNSIAYVVADPTTGRCAIIDPVLGFDHACRGIHTEFADRMAAFVRERGLTVEWILDTHPHADHLRRWCIRLDEHRPQVLVDLLCEGAARL